MYKIRKTESFSRDLRKLDTFVTKRIIEKLHHLAHNPDLGMALRHLPSDLAGLMKYRIGDWRVVFRVDHSKQEIILYGVDHRSTIYKKFR